MPGPILPGYYGRSCPLPDFNYIDGTVPPPGFHSGPWEIYHRWWSSHALNLRMVGGTVAQQNGFLDLWNASYAARYTQRGVKAASGEPFLDAWKLSGYRRYANDRAYGLPTGWSTWYKEPGDVTVQWVSSLPGAAEPHGLAYTELIHADNPSPVPPPSPFQETVLPNHPEETTVRISILSSLDPAADAPWYWEVCAHELGHAFMLLLEEEWGTDVLQPQILSLFNAPASAWNSGPWAARVVESAAETFKDIMLPLDAPAQAAVRAWLLTQGATEANVDSFMPTFLADVPRRKYDNRTNRRMKRAKFDAWKALFYDDAQTQHIRRDRIFFSLSNGDVNTSPDYRAGPPRQLYARGNGGVVSPFRFPAATWVWNRDKAGTSTFGAGSDPPPQITFGACWDVNYPVIPTSVLANPGPPTAGGLWSAFPATFWQLQAIIEGSNNNGGSWTQIDSQKLTITVASDPNWRWTVNMPDTSAWTAVRVRVIWGNIDNNAAALLPYHSSGSGVSSGNPFPTAHHFGIFAFTEWDELLFHPPPPQVAYPPWPYAGTEEVPGRASIGPGPRGRKIIATPTKTREVRDGHRLTREDAIRGFVSG